MNVTLRPEVEQFIAAQVRAGRFPSAEAVIEAAVTELVEASSGDAPDAEDWAAIAESDAEFDRGEGIDWADLKADFAKRFGTRP